MDNNNPETAPVPPSIASETHFVTSEVPVQPPEQLRFKPSKKIIIIASVIFVVVVLGTVLFAVMSSRPNPTQAPSPSPSPVVVATPSPIPSRYATDSGVLKIEADTNALDKELSEVDIDEDNLKPRALKWDVNFK